MKKTYSNPVLTVTSFTNEDIITVSGLNKEATQSNFDTTIKLGDVEF